MFGLTSLITLSTAWFDFPNSIVHRLVWFHWYHYASFSLISLMTLWIVRYDFPNNIMHRLVQLPDITMHLLVWLRPRKAMSCQAMSAISTQQLIVWRWQQVVRHVTYLSQMYFITNHDTTILYIFYWSIKGNKKDNENKKKEVIRRFYKLVE